MKTFLIGTITFVLLLICLPSFAQQLVPVNAGSNFYNVSDLSTVIQPGQAFFVYTHYPAGAISNSIFTYSDVVSGRVSIDWSAYNRSSSIGRRSEFLNSDGSETFIAIIDSENFYCQGSIDNARIVLSQTFQSFVDRGLGTVESRRRFFTLLESNIAPTPVFLVHFIKPWVVIGFAIFLSLPMWWVIKRALR